MCVSKILITGGDGFIGSHLAEAPLGAEHEVVCLDDLSTGSLENILPLKTNPRFRVPDTTKLRQAIGF
jgi:nucleoside-diphosphate-sugar epimerase